MMATVTSQRRSSSPVSVVATGSTTGRMASATIRSRGHALPRDAQTPRTVVLERLGTRSGDAHTSCVAVQCPRQQAQEALEVPPVASTVAVILLKAT